MLHTPTRCHVCWELQHGARSLPTNKADGCTSCLHAGPALQHTHTTINRATASACSDVICTSAYLLSDAVGLFGQCASLAAHEMSPLCKGQAVQVHCLAALGHAFRRVHGTCSHPLQKWCAGCHLCKYYHLSVHSLAGCCCPALPSAAGPLACFPQLRCLSSKASWHKQDLQQLSSFCVLCRCVHYTGRHPSFMYLPQDQVVILREKQHVTSLKPLAEAAEHTLQETFAPKYMMPALS